MATVVNIGLNEEEAPIFVVGKILTLQFHVTTGDRIVIQDDMLLGATSVTLSRPLETALSSGDRIRFGKLVIVLSSAAAIGARTLTITAATGGLFRQSHGKKVQDISGWALQWILGSDTNAYITKTTISGVAVTDGANGVATVDIVRADTYDDTPAVNTDPVLVPPGNYRHALARTDLGSEALLAEGDVQVFETISV